MKIILKNSFPTDESGTYAHYNHKITNFEKWEFIDVREYVEKKEKIWLDDIINWHEELLKVGLDNSELWEFLPCSRLISWYPPQVIKPLFFAKAVISLIEEKNIKKLYLIECPKEVIDTLQELKPDMKIINSPLNRLFSIKFSLKKMLTESSFGKQLILFMKILLLMNRARFNEKKVSGYSKIELGIYSQLLDKKTFISSNDHFFGKLFVNIKKSKKVWIYSSNLKKSVQKDIEEYLQTKNIKYFTINDLLSKADVIKVWVNCIKLTILLKSIKSKIPAFTFDKQRVKSFTNNYYNVLIKNQYPIDAFSVFYAFKRLFKVQNNISTLIYPYEEKGLEKAILKIVFPIT